MIQNVKNPCANWKLSHFLYQCLNSWRHCKDVWEIWAQWILLEDGYQLLAASKALVTSDSDEHCWLYLGLTQLDIHKFWACWKISGLTTAKSLANGSSKWHHNYCDLCWNKLKYFYEGLIKVKYCLLLSNKINLLLRSISCVSVKCRHCLTSLNNSSDSHSLCPVPIFHFI